MTLSRADRTVVRWLFVASTAFFLLIGNGVAKAGDEMSMREVAKSLVGERSITVPDLPFVGVPGTGGRTVSKYGIGQPVLAVPFEILGRLVSAPLEHPSPVREAVVVALMPFVTGALIAMSYVLGRRFGAAPRDALGVALVATIGSLGLVYGTEFFSEPLIGLLLLVSVERAVAQRWTPSFAALTAAMLVHARAAPLLVVLAIVAWRQIGWRRLLRSAWPVAVGLLAWALYGLARFGHPFDNGYRGEGFTTPLLDGIQGLLFVSSKSILLFAPLAVAGAFACWAMRRTQPVGAQLIMGFALGTFLLDATWHSWMGGWSWGPRFLMPVVPLLAVPLAPWLSADRRRWGAVGVLAAVGFAVSLPAVVVPSTIQKDYVPHRIGPSVVEQYRLADEVADSTRAWRCVDSIPSTTHLNDCTAALWQVHVMRSVGTVGDVTVLAISVALLGVTVIAGERCLSAATIAGEADRRPGRR